MPNDVSIQARNNADDGDIEVIGTDTNDNVQIGSNSNINNVEIPNGNVDISGNKIVGSDLGYTKNISFTGYNLGISSDNKITLKGNNNGAAKLAVLDTDSGNFELRGNLGLDMESSQIKNPVMDKRSSDPASPAVGQMWYRTDLD